MKTIVLVLLVLLLLACSRTDPDHFAGYAEAELVYLAPSGGGVLETLMIERGAQVAKNAVLYQLDNDAEVFARDAAQARAERAAAQAANLRKGRRADELRAIEQQLAQARAQLELSSVQLTRNEELVRQGFLSPLRLDELRAARERDAARVAELRAQLAVARDAARPDEIVAADAERRAAAFELQGTRWREEQKRRAAPTDAVVFDVMYRIGEWVPAGSPVLALLPAGAVKVRFFVPQVMLARIQVGQSVAVGCDGCPAGLTAKVNFISPQAEFTPPVIYSNESRSKLVFMVEAKPDDGAAAQLKPGQPVEVALVSRS